MESPAQPATLVVAEGQWHNMWSGVFECRELVEFVVSCATGPGGEEKGQ